MEKRKTADQDHGATAPASGGFQFITTTSAHGKPDKRDRKIIKSHIIRNRQKTRKSRELPSWINHEDENTSHTSKSITSIPKRVGSDYSLVQFPSFLKPIMLRDLMQCMYTLLSEDFYLL